MKRLGSLVLGVWLSAGAGILPALAQTNTTAPERSRFEEALQGLDLSPRQRGQIGKIVRDARANGQDRKQTVEQVRAVLTPDQREQLSQQMRQQVPPPAP
jgi:Spy/CpxP family protein refolding chaperone